MLSIREQAEVLRLRLIETSEKNLAKPDLIEEEREFHDKRIERLNAHEQRRSKAPVTVEYASYYNN